MHPRVKDVWIQHTMPFAGLPVCVPAPRTVHTITACDVIRRRRPAGVCASSILAIVVSVTVFQSAMAFAIPVTGSDLANPSDTTRRVGIVDSDPVLIRSTRFQLHPDRQPISLRIIPAPVLEASATRTLDQALERLSLVSVRSYGPGGSALLSVRGWGARSSQVLWGGLPLNHPMLGVADLSIIPVAGLSSIEFSPASGSVSHGSQGLGGTLYLRPQGVVSRAGGELRLGIGSFGDKEMQMRLQSPLPGGWSLSSLLSLQESDNDFTYRVRAFDPAQMKVREMVRRREHNARTRLDAQLNVHRVFERALLSTHLWIHDSENQIPGGIHSLSATASQADRALRWSSELLIRQGGGWIRATAGAARVGLDYADSAIGLASESRSDLLRLGLEQQGNPLPWLDQTRWVELRLDRIESTDYSRSRQVSTASAAQQGQISLGRDALLLLAGRVDIHSTTRAFWTGSVGVNLPLVEDLLYLRGNLARSHSSPTLNDLYWIPGGNPSLQAERGVHLESGLLLTLEPDRIQIRAELTPYLGQRSDGIRWMPIPGSSVWSPVNIESIRSRGAEALFSVTAPLHPLTTGRVSLHLQGQIQQVHPLRDSFADNRTVGRQIPFTPSQTFLGTIEWAGARTRVSWTSRWTGERYTTPDHSAQNEPLSGFLLSSVHLSSEVGGGLNGGAPEMGADEGARAIRPRFTLALRLDNLGDVRYQILENHPMPGRSLHAAFALRF